MLLFVVCCLFVTVRLFVLVVCCLWFVVLCACAALFVVCCLHVVCSVVWLGGCSWLVVDVFVTVQRYASLMDCIVHVSCAFCCFVWLC